eukprot:1937677-Rhodomonas_salina.2
MIAVVMHPGSSGQNRKSSSMVCSLLFVVQLATAVSHVSAERVDERDGRHDVTAEPTMGAMFRDMQHALALASGTKLQRQTPASPRVLHVEPREKLSHFIKSYATDEGSTDENPRLPPASSPNPAPVVQVRPLGIPLVVETVASSTEKQAMTVVPPQVAKVDVPHETKQVKVTKRSTAAMMNEMQHFLALVTKDKQKDHDVAAAARLSHATSSFISIPGVRPEFIDSEKGTHPAKGLPQSVIQDNFSQWSGYLKSAEKQVGLQQLEDGNWTTQVSNTGSLLWRSLQDDWHEAIADIARRKEAKSHSVSHASWDWKVDLGRWLDRLSGRGAASSSSSSPTSRPAAATTQSARAQRMQAGVRSYSKTGGVGVGEKGGEKEEEEEERLRKEKMVARFAFKVREKKAAEEERRREEEEAEKEREEVERKKEAEDASRIAAEKESEEERRRAKEEREKQEEEDRKVEEVEEATEEKAAKRKEEERKAERLKEEEKQRVREQEEKEEKIRREEEEEEEERKMAQAKERVASQKRTLPLQRGEGGERKNAKEENEKEENEKEEKQEERARKESLQKREMLGKGQEEQRKEEEEEDKEKEKKREEETEKEEEQQQQHWIRGQQAACA